MFERWFAKYARAVSDERERKRLYKKFCAKIISFIVFYVVCLAVIVEVFALSDMLDEGQPPATIAFAATLVLWLICAIVTLILSLNFRSAYNRILERPASEGEMPEITQYRRKVAVNRIDMLKSIWWAWAAFAAGILLFTVFIAIEGGLNPDGGEFGVWGYSAFVALISGCLVLFFGLFFFALKRMQKGQSIEQPTEEEEKAIDDAQGRKHYYTLQSDKNIQSLRYLFPDEELCFRAEELRKKLSNAVAISGVISVIVVVIASIVIFTWDNFGITVYGYFVPAAISLIFLSSIITSIPFMIKLGAIEKRQKLSLESNPAYAKNLEIYRLYHNFSTFKGKLIFIFVIAGLAISWLFAVIFPDTLLSCIGAVPILLGIFVNAVLVKGLRQKALPLEEEIDRERAMQAASAEKSDGAEDKTQSDEESGHTL